MKELFCSLKIPILLVRMVLSFINDYFPPISQILQSLFFYWDPRRVILRPYQISNDAKYYNTTVLKISTA